jgi:hypothetical protein
LLSATGDTNAAPLTVATNVGFALQPISVGGKTVQALTVSATVSPTPAPIGTPPVAVANETATVGPNNVQAIKDD